jgi:ABC-type transport system substrate-binding protein
VIRRRAAAVALAVACLASACSGGGDGDDETDGAPATTEDDEREVPVVGGDLRLGVATVASLDPADLVPDSVSATIAIDLLFDGLTRLPDGEAAATPGLASAWSSPDSLTWRFTIAPDARFGDGRAVTAADAEFSLERVLSRGGASLAASRLDAVAGAAEFAAAGGTAAGVDLPSITAVDATTLEIVLLRPMAWLPELLAAPPYGIVSEQGVQADGAAFAAGPTVGSGPFRLAERDGAVLSLVRAPDRRSYVDRIELHQYDDLSVAFDAFEDDQLDWTLLDPGEADVAAERYGSEGFVPFHADLYFGFNLNDPTFADVRFRQAIVQAVDRAALVNAVYFGVLTELRGVVPDGVPGADPTRCAAGCAYDPTAAAASLAAAFPNGGAPEVFIDFPDGADEIAAAGAIEQDLEAIGITATPRPHATAEYLTFAVSGGQALVSLGWVGVSPHPADYLDRLYRSDSTDNITGFADAGVDALLAQAATTQDPEARLALLAQVESAVLALAPTLVLAQSQVLAVAHDDVRDLDVGVTGTFDGEAVWLQP